MTIALTALLITAGVIAAILILEPLTTARNTHRTGGDDSSEGADRQGAAGNQLHDGSVL